MATCAKLLPTMPSFRVVLSILLIAFGLRVAAATYWHQQLLNAGQVFRFGDSDGYWVLASQIARGLPYQYGSVNAQVFRAPLLPLMLAPCTLLQEQADGVWWARMLGCCLGTLVVWQVMLLASRLVVHGKVYRKGDGGGSRHSGLAAGCAGIITACLPSAVGMSAFILSEMLLIPLMLAHILCWQNAWRSNAVASPDSQSKTIGPPMHVVLTRWSTIPWQTISWQTMPWSSIRWSLAAGMAAGFASLARPSWLLFTPFLLCVALAIGPNRGRHLRIAVFSVAGICLVMSPWWVRNLRVTGEFVPTTLQVGPSLYDGLHPGASGASDEGMAFMQNFVAEQMAADAESTAPLRGAFESRVNRRATQAAWQWTWQNPGEALRLAWIKFCRTWSLWPDGGDAGSPAIRLAITLGTFGILLLAIRGTWLLRFGNGWCLAICWVPCLYFTLLHMLFVGSIRYREPAIVVLASLAGCAVAHFFKSVARPLVVTAVRNHSDAERKD